MPPDLEPNTVTWRVLFLTLWGFMATAITCIGQNAIERFDALNREVTEIRATRETLATKEWIRGYLEKNVPPESVKLRLDQCERRLNRLEGEP